MAGTDRLPADEAGRARLRDRLIGQAAFLADEMENLRQVVSDVPEHLLSSTPFGGQATIKEMLALMALADRDVHPRQIDAMIHREQPALFWPSSERPEGEVEWSDLPVDDLLLKMIEVRHRLVHQLEVLSPEAWDRVGVIEDTTITLYDYLQHLILANLEVLRSITYRLYETSIWKRSG